MLDVRPALLVRGQDENAGPSLAIRNKENALGVGFGLGKPSVQPLGTRKALGNITNTSGSKLGENAGKPGLPAPSKEGRRALGDITNSGPSLRQPLGGLALKPSSSKPLGTLPQPLKLPLQQRAAPVLTSIPVPAQQRSKAEVYAEAGIERLAGKSWAEQEADRQRKENAEISGRVTRFTSGLASWRPATFSPASSSKVRAAA